MRREGYELQVSRPEVILQKDERGKNTEPFEDGWIEVPENYSGAVIEKMGRRKGELRDMKTENGTSYFHFHIPTRGLIGYRNEFLTDTRGTGILNSLFAGYEPYAEGITSNPHGSLIAFEDGESNTYGLVIAEGRGVLFIGPNVQVYKGMIVGQNAKAEDLDVNVCKTKRLSNMRSKGDGTAEALSPPRVLTLEEAIEYIGDDELVEVTPKSIRLRKRELDSLKRKRDKIEVQQKG
jgi:GTP-binding protein